mgnify:CR=1 FL=1
MELVTGFKSLDEAIGGLQYGCLVTLAGRPRMRTQYFIYTMMRSWIKSNLIKDGFVFFSLSDRKERVYKHLFGLDYTDEAVDTKYVVEMERSEIYLSVLCDKIRMYAWKEDKRVFVIDKFNDLENGGISNVYYEMLTIAKTLSKLAHELDVIIIVNAVLFSNYIEGEGIDAKVPSFADLGYEGMPGDLDVFSDVVLSFWSPEKYRIYLNESGDDLSNIVQIEVLKNVYDDASEGKRLELYMDNKTGTLY